MLRPTRRPLLGLVLCLTGCLGGDSATATPLLRLLVLGGDGQMALAGAPVPEPIRLRVVDARGAPIAGASIDLVAVSGGGRPGSTGLTTDASGEAAALWVLGAEAGPQRLRATVAGGPSIELIATAVLECPAAGCALPDVDGPAAFVLLDLPTADGSGQVVHPDLSLGGGRLQPRLLAFTPYPFGDATHENPALAESHAGLAWRVPPGVRNPLATPSGGHLSDPDIVRVPDASGWRIYFREVVANRNRIRLISSPDGIQWSEQPPVLDVPSHRAISPAVVAGAPHAPWQMWTVDAGGAGCSARATVLERRTSVDGRHWDAPTATDLAQPGQVIWHVDVQWMPDLGEYWALYNSYPVGGTCVTRALFLATSTDGLHWSTPAAPLIVAGELPGFRDVVYRGTFRRSGDGRWIELYLSGADFDQGRYRWRAGRMVIAAEHALADGGTTDRDDGWQRPSDVPLPPPEPADMP